MNSKSEGVACSADCRPFILGLGVLNKFVLLSNNGKNLANIADAEMQRLKLAGDPYMHVCVVTATP